MAEWSGGKVAAYDVDPEGDPIASTRRDFFSTFPKPWGAYFEAVTGDFERWSYNTAVAHTRELVNLLTRYIHSDGGVNAAVVQEALDSVLLLLAPMTPHVAAELWERRHPDAAALHAQRWPTFDPALVRASTVTLVIQVNGKLRGLVVVAAAATNDCEPAATTVDPSTELPSIDMCSST